MVNSFLQVELAEALCIILILMYKMQAHASMHGGQNLTCPEQDFNSI